jgi:phosphoglycerate dehydrogenase-like enzyme
MRVAVLDDIHNVYERTAGIRRLRERVEVTVFSEPFGSPENLRGYEGLIANRERTRFTRELLQQLPDLRIIAQTGNHVYHIDMDAVRERGLVVAKAAGGFSVGTAELTFGLMLALARQIPKGDRDVKAGIWQTPSTPVLHGKTLGIVGLGNIGSYVATIARAFGMRVVAWSQNLTDDRARKVGAVRARELDDLLREADFVTLHYTLSPRSRGMLDARRLALMKPGAYLVNTSRGPLVDEAALVEALAAGRIAGAGLDVFDVEPLPAGHPLTKLPNVVLTPHIGWPTDEGYSRFADSCADAILAYLDGREFPQWREAH